MPKKRKLNSSNPKYKSKASLQEKPIKKRKLMCEVNKIKIYGVWYEQKKAKKTFNDFYNNSLHIINHFNNGNNNRKINLKYLLWKIMSLQI